VKGEESSRGTSEGSGKSIGFLEGTRAYTCNCRDTVEPSDGFTGC
jgi:hypothetical protein